MLLLVSRVLRALLAVAAVVLALWAPLWWWAPEDWRTSFFLLALTPVAAVAGLVVAALALGTRRWVSGSVALVAALVLVVLVAPRALPAGAGPVEAEGALPDSRPLTVATTNLQFGRADARELVELVRSERVDVLSLQELTPDAEGRLTSAGLFAALPFRATRARDGAGGSGLASRHPLAPTAVALRPAAFEQVAARVEVPGAPVDVVATHPNVSVLDGPVGRWAGEIRGLPRPRTAAEVPLVVAGDLNATLDHRPLRALLDAGHVDAAAAVGDGLAGTWPTEGFPVPFVAIDHVLVSGPAAATATRTRPLTGTDHAALVATLAVGRPGPGPTVG